MFTRDRFHPLTAETWYKQERAKEEAGLGVMQTQIPDSIFGIKKDISCIFIHLGLIPAADELCAQSRPQVGVVL